MDDVTNHIPPALLNTLVMLRGTLEERGHVQRRTDHKTPSYRLRVRAYTHEGIRRCLAIPIPDESVPAVN